jgi:hypothetical protein
MKNIIARFKVYTRKSFEDLRRVLDEKYCWKCPQRSTRENIGCREADAWMRLRSALEDELRAHLMETLGRDQFDRVLLRMRERECTGDLRIIRRRGEYLVVLDSVSGIKIGHEVLVGSRVLRVKKLAGVRLITDHGEHPLHEIEGRVLGRIGPRHQLYRELMNWRNRNGS